MGDYENTINDWLKYKPSLLSIISFKQIFLNVINGPKRL